MTTEAVDTVTEILDVAVSVLGDYAGGDSNTRIERMARWIALNLGVQVIDVRDGDLSTISTDEQDIVAVQIGERVGVKAGPLFARPMSTESARQLATALYICIERAEQV